MPQAVKCLPHKCEALIQALECDFLIACRVIDYNCSREANETKTMIQYTPNRVNDSRD
jgi:hypothetical protein